MTNPKGLAFDGDGNLFFVDGTRIRVLRSRDNIVETFAGSLAVHGARPVPCQGSISLDQVKKKNLVHFNRAIAFFKKNSLRSDRWSRGHYNHSFIMVKWLYTFLIMLTFH